MSSYLPSSLIRVRFRFRVRVRLRLRLRLRVGVRVRVRINGPTRIPQGRAVLGSHLVLSPP